MDGALLDAAMVALREYADTHPDDTDARQDLEWAEEAAHIGPEAPSSSSISGCLFTEEMEEQQPAAAPLGEGAADSAHPTESVESGGVAPEDCAIAEGPPRPTNPTNRATLCAPTARTVPQTAANRSHKPAQAPRVAVQPRELALPPVVYVEDEAGLRAALTATAGAPVLGFDCETTGLDPHRDRLRLVQVATPEAVYALDIARLGSAAALMRPWLAGLAQQGTILAGQNLAFDVGFLQGAGLLPDGPADVCVFDAMIAEQVLTCASEPWSLREAGRHTLAAVARRRLGVTLDKAEQVSDWSGDLRPEQIEYAARDAILPFHLLSCLQAAAAADGLARVLRLEQALVPVIGRMEYHGVGFDAGYWRGFASGLTEDASSRRDAFLAALPEAHRAMNPASPKQVVALFEALGIPLPPGEGKSGARDTSEAALRALAAKHPEAELLLAFRTAAKAAGTYGSKYLRHVHPATGRVHCQWHQIGAATGRMSCSAPNLQQLPHDPRFRRGVVPGDGMTFIVADYSQIELRLAARLTGDAAMTAAFAAGQDIHRSTAAALSGKALEDVTPEERQAAKAANFGLLYGAGARTLASVAADSYGVRWTEKEARKVREAWLARYRGISAWHALTKRKGPPERETRTPLGRARRWRPLTPRGWEPGVWSLTEMLNTPVQGAGADLLKSAMVALAPALRAIGARLVLAVHDELVAEVPADRAEEARGLVVAAMEEAGRAMLDPVPCRAEAVVAASWAEKP